MINLYPNRGWLIAFLFTLLIIGALGAIPTITHNTLDGLQGGTTDEYYHFTSSQHTTITGNYGNWDTAYGWGDHASGGYQAQGDVLDDLNTLGANPFSGDPDKDFLVGTEPGVLAWESGATVRTSLGLGAGDSPTFSELTLTVAGNTYFSLSDGIIYMPGGELRAGQDDTVKGSVVLYGDESGNYGGRVQLYCSAAYDTTIDFYRMQVFQDTLYIGSSTYGNALKLANNNFYIMGGNLDVEGDVTATGKLKCSDFEIELANNPTISFDETNTGVADATRTVGIIKGKGRSTTDAEVIFAQWNFDSLDATNGSEDGQMVFQTMLAGTLTTHMVLWKDRLGVGTGTPGQKLDVNGDIAVLNGNELRFFDVGNSNYVGFEAPALTANQIWVLPAADGPADEIIKTDGAGNFSFVRMPKAIYAELSDTTDQAFAVAGTAYSITFDSNDEISGVTHSVDADTENITIVTSGVYTIFAQPQVAAAAGGAGVFHMWLQRDTGGGFVDIANTNIELSLSSLEEDVIPLATTFSLDSGDIIRLRASASDTQIKLDAQTPAGEPAIPSIIFTMFMIGT